MRRNLPALVIALAAGLVAAPAAAQEAEGPKVLEVGETAPDFELTGSTRFGVLRDKIRLSDFRGKTVVLAFFFRARTRG